MTRNESPNQSFWTSFWDNVCLFYHYILFFFVLVSLMVVMALTSLVFIDNRSGSFVILVFDFAILLVLFPVVVYAMIQCRRRQ